MHFCQRETFACLVAVGLKRAELRLLKITQNKRPHPKQLYFQNLYLLLLFSFVAVERKQKQIPIKN